MTKYTITDLNKQLFHYDDFEGIIDFAVANGCVYDEDEIMDTYEWSMGGDGAIDHHIADFCLDYISEHFTDDTVRLAVIDGYWTIVPSNYYGD